VLLVDPPDPDCALLQYADSQFEVRRYDVVNPPTVGEVVGVGVLGVLAGAATCELACADDSSWKRASDITLITAGALLGGALVWAFLSCAGRWGQPGCRD
jgi:hypothetical protein